jgi:RNA polymerase sigma-70 factor (ECF subfamily)
MTRRKSVFAPLQEQFVGRIDAGCGEARRPAADPDRRLDRAGGHEVQRKELREVAGRAIGELRDLRAVVVLRDIEELTTEESAESVGRLHRGDQDPLHRGRWRWSAKSWTVSANAARIEDGQGTISA